MAAAEPAVCRDAVDPQSHDWRIWNRPPRPCPRNVRQKRARSSAQPSPASHPQTPRPRKGAGWGVRWSPSVKRPLRRRARRTCRAYHRRDAAPCDDRNRHCRHSVSQHWLGAEHPFGRPPRVWGHRSCRRPRPMGARLRSGRTLTARLHCSGCEERQRNHQHAEGKDVAYRWRRPYGLQDTRSRGWARTCADAAFPTGMAARESPSPSPQKSVARFAGASQVTPSQRVRRVERDIHAALHRTHRNTLTMASKIDVAILGDHHTDANAPVRNPLRRSRNRRDDSV